ncbi:MAG: glucosaminidase domain-containing protein [Bacteroidota bacterium]
MLKSLQILFVGMLFHFSLSANTVPTKYIEKYRDLAQSEMQRTGIPASIKLAQGILESNFGRSKLAQRANNHFGIKCGGDWVGKTFYKEDDDYDNRGRLRKSCFRKYDKEIESWLAHSEFLKKPRYQHLYYLRPDDYKAWARGLRQAGYATSPTYASDLISVIERYELYRYDQVESQVPAEVLEVNQPVVITEPEVRPDSRMSELAIISSVNDVKVTHSLDGENLNKISERTGISVNSLIRYNELLTNSSRTLKTGTRVFLQPKRSSNRAKQNWHKVMPGESMFDIAQKYGIRLNKMYERNRMEEGTQPAVGEQILLRGRRTDTPNLRNAKQPKETVEVVEEEQSLPVPTPDFGRLEEEDMEEDFMEEEEIVFLDELEIPVEPISIPSVETNVDLVERPKEEVLFEELDLEAELSTPTLPAAKDKATYYTVQSKDTLFSIARSYGSSVDQIRSWNDLDGDTIHPNQRLRVK